MQGKGLRDNEVGFFEDAALTDRSRAPAGGFQNCPTNCPTGLEKAGLRTMNVNKRRFSRL
jgi:hypothetical protein